jgi:hypothetical protein
VSELSSKVIISFAILTPLLLAVILDASLQAKLCPSLETVNTYLALPRDEGAHIFGRVAALVTT